MRFDDRVTGDVSRYAKQAKVVHIDIDAAEINKIIKADAPVLADAKEALAFLTDLVEKQNHQSWLDEFHHAKENELQVLSKNRNKDFSDELRMDLVIDLLSQKTNGNAVIVTDVGQHQMMAAQFYQYNQTKSNVTSGGLGTMGFALPAAIATLVLILVLSFQTDIAGRVSKSYNLVQIIPYVLVLIGGIIGINVFVVLLIGIVSGSIIMLAGGHIAATDLLANMGSGASGMFETSMVAILVAAMCALIREYGGFDALLAGIHKVFKGRKGGQLGMGLLVGAMDIATANNTVAIVMANPIAKDMAKEYGITPKKTASILDTFSCIFQGIIPYGAQMLVAISAASELGYRVSAFQIMPKLFYPFLLFVSSMIFIFLIPSKKER